MPTVAGTMAFVTFVFFQVFNLLNVRNDLRSVFSRETLENRSAFVATAAVIVLLALIVEMDVLHEFFTTTDLTSGQWLAAWPSARPSCGSANSSRSCSVREPGGPPDEPGDRPAVGITDGPDRPTPVAASLIAFTGRLAKVRINSGIRSVGDGLIASVRVGIERFQTELIKSASRVARSLP